MGIYVSVVCFLYITKDYNYVYLLGALDIGIYW